MSVVHLKTRTDIKEYNSPRSLDAHECSLHVQQQQQQLLLLKGNGQLLPPGSGSLTGCAENPTVRGEGGQRGR